MRQEQRKHGLMTYQARQLTRAQGNTKERKTSIRIRFVDLNGRPCFLVLLLLLVVVVVGNSY